MKVVIFGASGLVGQGVLLQTLDAPEVEGVLSVGRRSQAVTSGHSIKAVQAQLGRRSEQSTHVYAHVGSEAQRRLVESARPSSPSYSTRTAPDKKKGTQPPENPSARPPLPQAYPPNAKEKPPPSGKARVGRLRGPDLNRRPSGYEPDELPSCSTPR